MAAAPNELKVKLELDSEQLDELTSLREEVRALRFKNAVLEKLLSMFCDVQQGRMTRYAFRRALQRVGR